MEMADERTVNESGTVERAKPSLFRNALSNWLPLGTNMVLKFLLIPFLIARLGTARYGIWILVSSFVGYYGLLRLDVGSGVMRYVPFYAGQNRRKEAGEIISTAMAVYISVGVLVLVLSNIIAEPLTRFYEGGKEFSLLVRVMGLAASFECVMRIFEVSLRAFEKWISANIVVVTVSILQAAGLALCVYRGLGLFEMGLVVAGATVVSLLLMLILFRHCCRDIRLSMRGIRFHHLKSLTTFGVLTMIVTLVGTFRIQGHELIIGKLISVEAVGIYAVAGWLIKDAKALVTAPNRVFWPRFAWLDGGKKTTEVSSLFVRSTKVNAIFSAGLVLIIMTAGSAFINLWVGKGFESVFGALMILAAAVLIETSLTSTGMLLAGTGRQRFQAIAMLMEGVIGIGLGIVFVRYLGLAGMALGYLISVSLMRGVVCVWYICRIFGMSMFGYYADAVLRPWLILFLLAGAAKAVGISSHLNSWVSLIAFVFVVCVVYSGFVYFVGIDSDTRKSVLEKMKRAGSLVSVRAGFVRPADVNAVD